MWRRDGSGSLGVVRTSVCSPHDFFVLNFDSGLAVLPRLGPNLSRRVGFSKVDVGHVQKRKEPAVGRLGWMGSIMGFGRSSDWSVETYVAPPSLDESSSGWTGCTTG